MNTMTTTQAAQMAFDLSKKGFLTNRMIGRELAKAGYISFRSGRALSAAGVYAMLKKMEKGEPIADRKPSKYSKISKKLARRAANTAAKRTSRAKAKAAQEAALQKAAPVQSQVAVTKPHANIMNEENQARAVMNKAMERVLEMIFGIKVRVILPLDRSFRATQD